MSVAAQVLISLDVKSFDRHGFPWLQSTKHIYNIDNNIYKKSTFFSVEGFFFCFVLIFFFTKLVNHSTLPPSPTTALHFSLLVLPARSKGKPTVAPVCVLRLGSGGTERLLSLQLPTVCNGSSPPFPNACFNSQLRSSQTMKEF